MSAIDDALEGNAQYAASFDKGDLPLPPARGLAVVACMDARLNVHGLLGISRGRRPRHSQCRRRGVRRRHPLSGHLAAIAGHT